GGVREVVRKRVGDRGVGRQRLLGGGDVDPLRQLEHFLGATVEANQELAGHVGGVRGDVCSLGRRGPEGSRDQDERGCGDQLSHGPRIHVPGGGRRGR